MATKTPSKATPIPLALLKMINQAKKYTKEAATLPKDKLAYIRDYVGFDQLALAKKLQKSGGFFLRVYYYKIVLMKDTNKKAILPMMDRVPGFRGTKNMPPSLVRLIEDIKEETKKISTRQVDRTRLPETYQEMKKLAALNKCKVEVCFYRCFPAHDEKGKECPWEANYTILL